MLLSELKTGESAVITKVKGYGAFRKRLNEMGFVRGKVVKAVKNAPLNDPIEYSIMGYEISLGDKKQRLLKSCLWRRLLILSGCPEVPAMRKKHSPSTGKVGINIYMLLLWVTPMREKQPCLTT